MSSETDVANVSLRMIGQGSISSRTDGTENGNIVDDLFDDVRDDCLRYNPWNFATKRVELAKSSTAPAFEFDFAFPLPADWIRTVSVHNNDIGRGTILHRMEVIGGQRCIVASSQQVFLRFIYQEKDPNIWTSDFRRTVELALARDLAVPIAASNVLQDQLNKEFKKAMNRARSSDAMGATPEARPRGSWAASRGRFGNDRYLND